MPPSSSAPLHAATTGEEIVNEEAHADNNSAITHEKQEDATNDQGKLINHEPGDASDPNRTRVEFQNGRCLQDADTFSSWSSLPSPSASDDEHDRTSDNPGDELKSLAGWVELQTLNGVPSRLSRSARPKLVILPLLPTYSCLPLAISDHVPSIR